MKRIVWLWSGLLLGLMLVGWWGGMASVGAGVITVCPAGCDYATIQGAVDAAAPLSTLQIFSATYTETVIITKSLTLEGGGQPQPVVSGNDVGRPFTILGNVAVTMTNMTVTRGRAPLENDGSARGGGIFNQGQLTLDHVTLSYNQAIGANGDTVEANGQPAFGGGLYSECVTFTCGTLSIHNSVVISNTAVGGDGLDAFAQEAMGNGGWGYRDGGWAHGGGLYLECEGTSGQHQCGQIEIVESVIANNSALGGEGGDRSSGGPSGLGGYALGGGLNDSCEGSACSTTQISRSEIHHNIAYAGDGGYTPHIFSGSGPANGHGGGLFLTTDADIAGSFIHHNVAHSSDYFVLSSPYDWRTSSGGGVYTREGETSISKSTVWQNEADLGGGIAVFDQSLKIENSTISQNVARECGGGALLQSNYDLRLDYVTITDNIALGYANPRRCGDEYEEGAGSGVYIHPYLAGVLNMKSSILARNSEPNHVGGDCYKNVYSRGFNLIEKTNHCVITGIPNGNLFHLDPMLGPLQDNGGLTPTHALLAGSVAIDAAAPTDCPNTDQRQYPRWIDGNGDGIERCDMGAYEYGGAPTDVGMVNEVRGRSTTPLLPLIFSFLTLLVFYVLRTTHHAARG